jgi:acetolactate synthase-1/3 small subunit
MTGSASKIEGLIQVLRESNYNILEVSRTGRMAMRRGHHTTRVLKALGTTPGGLHPAHFPTLDPDALDPEETLPNAFDE